MWGFSERQQEGGFVHVSGHALKRSCLVAISAQLLGGFHISLDSELNVTTEKPLNDSLACN